MNRAERICKLSVCMKTGTVYVPPFPLTKAEGHTDFLHLCNLQVYTEPGAAYVLPFPFTKAEEYTKFL